jgi:hypothetical protein
MTGGRRAVLLLMVVSVGGLWTGFYRYGIRDEWAWVVKVERTVRALEPRVRQAVAEAAVIARGVRAGVAAYREGRPRKR